jgi:hypothetical protein
MAARDCMAEIRRRSGAQLTDDELEEFLTRIADMAQRGDPGVAMATRLLQAANELAGEIRAAAAIERRNRIQNLEKRVARREFYLSAPAVGRTAGPMIGLEAKLVGVNTPFAGARLSVDAEGKALLRDLVDGFSIELDKAGHFEAFRSGVYDRQIAVELAELNRREGGQPGVTGSRIAREIAEIVQRFQKRNVDAQNAAGAWIGSYDGYIVRTSHDGERMRRAGYETWRDQILPRLDARTFDGIQDRDKFLRSVYTALVSRVHLTAEGAHGFKDPAFVGPGNLAKRLSQGRQLHFRDAGAWFEYHEQFGQRTLAESVLASFELGARNAALMRQFGTNPRAEFEADIRWMRETRRDDFALMEQLRRGEKALANRFDVLDGTARMAVNEMAARIGSGWRTWQNMSKLGGVVLSAIADVPIKASELRYQGVGLLQGYADGFASIVRGRGRGEQREVADLLRAGAEGMRGALGSRFDVTDTVPGTLAKLQDRFFAWTGLKYWTDAQRAGAELVMARALGRQKDAAWSALAPETQRVLELYDIGQADWDMLRAQTWRQADGRTYLTPDVAQRVDEQAILDELGRRGAVAATARDIAAYRRDLGLRLQAFYADRAEFAVLNPGARERAILLQGTRPGTPEGEALRFFAQFKAFPVAVVTKVWGREIYGGQDGFGRLAGVTHMLAASIVFGYLAMAAKDLAKGRTPRDPTSPKTWAAAFVQGGGAGIYGDFLFGEYNRFGKGFLASVGGPTAGAVEDIVDLWNRVKRGDDVAASLLKTAVAHTPFANLFYTRVALDYLLLYQLQEMASPGFLQRMERRIERENGQNFILRPSEAIPFGGGSRILEGLR